MRDAEKEVARLSVLVAELHKGQCAGYRDLLDTVRSVARMLGWEHPPPRETLESKLRALLAGRPQADAAQPPSDAVAPSPAKEK